MAGEAEGDAVLAPGVLRVGMILMVDVDQAVWITGHADHPARRNGQSVHHLQG
jgi:hypothetical protein